MMTFVTWKRIGKGPLAFKGCPVGFHKEPFSPPPVEWYGEDKVHYINIFIRYLLMKENEGKGFGFPVKKRANKPFQDKIDISFLTNRC